MSYAVPSLKPIRDEIDANAAAIAAGSIQEIASVDLTSYGASSVTFSGLDLTGYKALRMVLSGVKHGSANRQLRMVVNTVVEMFSTVDWDAHEFMSAVFLSDLATGNLWYGRTEGSKNATRFRGAYEIVHATTDIEFQVLLATNFTEGSIVLQGVK